MRLKQTLRTLYNLMPILGDLRRVRQEMTSLRDDVQAVRKLLASTLKEQIISNSNRHAENARLARHEVQACSQNGEDGVLQEIFRRIDVMGKVFVEVGVGNGLENNTSFLLSCGWSGFWLDGDPEIMPRVQHWQRHDPDCLKGRTAFVTRENVHALFDELGVPKEFDLLSIDIDQNTYHIWGALRAYRPRVVVVEYNASIPPGVEWKVEYVASRMWDGTTNFGASLKAFESLGNQLGYSLVGCDLAGVNAFFVRNDLVGNRFAGPFTAENHYEPTRYVLGQRLGHPPAILDREAAWPQAAEAINRC